ncbi:MAG: ABC transporter permease [Anaerolineae bacterium]|nr:ABC transporter permease [Thermoflexales bacterium]MDW8406938.1 ABC transporter permease [Anaerolineae bacterium]
MFAIGRIAKAQAGAEPALGQPVRTCTGDEAQTSKRVSRHTDMRVGVRRWVARLGPAALFSLFVATWHTVSLNYPPFILPSPAAVAERFFVELFAGRLLHHTAATLSEAIPGLAIGALAAFMLGYPIAKSALADRLLSPFIVASQGIPFIAIAPLLLIWFGPGPAAKIFLCAIVVFFPIMVNIIAGVRSIKPLLRDLFRSLHATAWETFIKLEAPAALPLALTGLRIGATLSMIGAIAAEFLGTDRGLGFLINQGRGMYDTTLVMVGIAATVITALGMYTAVRALEQVLIARRG